MTQYTTTMNVTFVLEYATIIVTVGDLEDWDFVVDEANDLIGDTCGFYPKDTANTIIVTNQYGEIEEN